MASPGSLTGLNRFVNYLDFKIRYIYTVTFDFKKEY